MLTAIEPATDHHPTLPPVTDGPFAETKDLIAGWMAIDVETYERALELAGEQ